MFFTDFFCVCEGGTYKLKCHGIDNDEKCHYLYLQVNCQNELIAIKNVADASEFEIESSESNKFTVKFDGLYLSEGATPRDPLKIHSNALHLALDHHNKDKCTVDIFKEGGEVYSVKAYGSSFWSDKQYLCLSVQDSTTQASGSTVQQEFFAYLKKKPPQKEQFSNFYFLFRLEKCS